MKNVNRMSLGNSPLYFSLLSLLMFCLIFRPNQFIGSLSEFRFFGSHVFKQESLDRKLLTPILEFSGELNPTKKTDAKESYLTLNVSQ